MLYECLWKLNLCLQKKDEKISFYVGKISLTSYDSQSYDSTHFVFVNFMFNRNTILKTENTSNEATVYIKEYI